MVSAKDTVSTTPKGLTVSPLRTEFTIDPGTSQTGNLSIMNVTDASMAVRVEAEEFRTVNQQYDYAFTAESDTASWVSFATNDIELAAGEQRTIAYAIGVPLSAEPGGRYISLFASNATSEAPDGISSVQRVGSLLYMTINGDVTRSGNLIALGTPFIVGGPSQWSATLQNTGTTHYRSRYSVSIQNIIGSSNEIARMDGSALILPGTVRLLSDTLPMPSVAGIYKAIYTIGLGDSPSKIETRIFLYAPPLAIAFGIGASVVLIGLVVVWHHRRTR